ncbi:metallophosphoesterase [Craurococcus roseus]|uniref:Metallophosphoesterase n=2 Tax=Craurococcus roseus TaxID=77585 RepID=A0ABP3QIF4_9PROT
MGAAIGAGLSTAAYALGVEPGLRLRMTRYALTPPNWPPGFHLRLGVVADLHAGEPHMGTDRVRRVVAAANALRPDVMLFLGDLNASHRFLSRRFWPGETAALLADLRAPLGTYAILGNHDWWEDEAAQQANRGPTEAHGALERNGIPVLENTGRRLVKDGRPFWLLGLGDQWAWWGGSVRRLHRGGVDDLPATLAVADDDAPAILMAHEPDIFPQVPSRIAVTLAGHTHGGQGRLFGWAPFTASKFGNRYAYGHVVEGDRHLIVSGGLGCSVAPVRFGAPPEIVLVELGQPGAG